MKERTKRILTWSGVAALVAAAAVTGKFLSGRCLHHKYSRVFSAGQNSGEVPDEAQYTGYWVQCIDCGDRLPYDYQHMKVLSLSQARALLLAKHKAARAVRYQEA